MKKTASTIAAASLAALASPALAELSAEDVSDIKQHIGVTMMYINAEDLGGIRMRLTPDAEGRIVDCEVTGSSGRGIIDLDACNAVTGRITEASEPFTVTITPFGARHKPWHGKPPIREGEMEILKCRMTNDVWRGGKCIPHREFADGIKTPRDGSTTTCSTIGGTTSCTTRSTYGGRSYTTRCSYGRNRSRCSSY